MKHWSKCKPLCGR